jgi:hypothetical protein
MSNWFEDEISQSLSFTEPHWDVVADPIYDEFGEMITAGPPEFILRLSDTVHLKVTDDAGNFPNPEAYDLLIKYLERADVPINRKT